MVFELVRHRSDYNGELCATMVLEKQDSGISLASTDGQDRKMSESDARDLVKGQALSKQDKQMGGSDTKLNALREKSETVIDTKDSASDNGIVSDKTAPIGDFTHAHDNALVCDHDDDDLDLRRLRSVSDVGPHRSDSTSTDEQDDVISESDMSTYAFRTRHDSEHASELSEIRQRPIRTRNVVGRSQSMHTAADRRRKPVMRLYEFEQSLHDESGSSGGGGDGGGGTDCSHSDLTAIIGEQEQLLPLHKTVCCALCR